MKYNTEQKRLVLPEYGRSIQNMVNHALTIEDRKERQRCANTIIGIMGNMFPHLRDVPDFKHKLWDHLAIMSDFKLDIDYPYPIIRPDEVQVKPEVLDYPQRNIKYRHYGALIEDMIKACVAMPDDVKKLQLTALICNHMKKEYGLWNKDNVDDRKIAEDLYEMSEGQLQMTEEVMVVMKRRMDCFYRPDMMPPVKQQNGGKNKNLNKNNKKTNKNNNNKSNNNKKLVSPFNAKGQNGGSFGPQKTKKTQGNPSNNQNNNPKR